MIYANTYEYLNISGLLYDNEYFWKNKDISTITSKSELYANRAVNCLTARQSRLLEAESTPPIILSLSFHTSITVTWHCWSLYIILLWTTFFLGMFGRVQQHSITTNNCCLSIVADEFCWFSYRSSALCNLSSFSSLKALHGSIEKYNHMVQFLWLLASYNPKKCQNNFWSYLLRTQTFA